jgi:hypothetical protein
MPQPVRPRPRKARPSARPFHDVTDQVRKDRPARSPAGKEQPPGTGRSPALRQVAGQGLVGVSRQREPVLAACLPPDAELTRRQSTSRSSSRATSIDRRPSRATSIMIAKCFGADLASR